MMGIDRDGVRFCAYSVVVAGFAWFVSSFLFYVSLLFAVWCLYFFRDPQRNIPQTVGILVSPADGRVIKVSNEMPHSEIPLSEMVQFIKVSIFMNVFNVHVNRVMASGSIREIIYKKGKFFNASFDKASEHNERNSLIVDIPEHNSFVVFTQIAGLIARRIRCDAKKFDIVTIGEKFGIIRFGSRLDVYMPAKDYEACISVGQKTVAGETIIGRLKN